MSFGCAKPLPSWKVQGSLSLMGAAWCHCQPLDSVASGVPVVLMRLWKAFLTAVLQLMPLVGVGTWRKIGVVCPLKGYLHFLLLLPFFSPKP